MKPGREAEGVSLLKKAPLWNPRPLLPGAAGTLIGGVLALRLDACWLLGLGLVALLLSLPLVYKRHTWCFLPLLLGLTLLRGIFLPRDILPQGEYLLRGQIVSLPRQEREGQVVELWQLSARGQNYAGTLSVTLPAELDAQYGDWVQGRIFIRNTPYTVAPRQWGEGIVQGEMTVEKGQGPVLYGWVLRLRAGIEEHTDALFAPYAGEAKGMLLGQKTDISYTSYQAFVDSGLVHLLTVSGLHVGILCGAVFKLIRGRRWWLRGLLAGSILLLYVVLTGFSPSTLRAAIMVFAAFILRACAREEDSLGVLSLSFCVLVLADPRFLNSLGFQLSYGAVWGLLMLEKPIADLWPGRKNELWNSMAASMGATWGTLPLLARVTGQVQWVGVFLSPAVLPVAAWFLIPGWLAIGLHALWAPLGELAALVPKGVLAYIVRAARLGTVHPLTLSAPGWPVLALWFAALFFLSPFFLPNKKRPPWVGYALLAAALSVWMLGI